MQWRSCATIPDHTRETIGAIARDDVALPDGYPRFLGDLKRRVHDAQVRAQRTVNTQLIELYWSIGCSILSEQEKQGWGAGVMDRLAHDLRLEFPQMTGLSRTNHVLHEGLRRSLD